MVEAIRNLKSLLDSYENLLEEERLRSQVQALIPIYVYTGILGLGDSLFPQDIVASPWSRLLHYFLQNQNKVINQDELTIVAGDKRWENYVRDLTRKFGWPIINGITAQELIESGEPILEGTSIEEIRSDAYILLNDRQDRDAAFRWYIARRLRKKKNNLPKQFINTSLNLQVTRYLRKKFGSLQMTILTGLRLSGNCVVTTIYPFSREQPAEQI
jgi:hypothetical protein